MKSRLDQVFGWATRHSGFVVLVLLGAACSVWLATHVEVLGEIPRGFLPLIVQREIELDYAMGILWWSLIAVGLWLLGGSERHLLLTGWVVKFFVVLVVMLFYEFHYRYNLDAFGYFRSVLSGEYYMYEGVDWRRESWIPAFTQMTPADSLGPGGQFMQSSGTENMLRLLQVIGQVTGPYYHAVKVVYAFSGFLGIWFFYRALVVILGRPSPLAFYALALYPSILFWSSTLGKDPVIFLFIAMYAYGSVVWLVRGAPSGLAWVGLGVILSALVRPWMAAIEAVPLLVAGLAKYRLLAPTLLAVSLGLTASILLGTSFGLQTLLVVPLSEVLQVRVEGVRAESLGGGSAGENLGIELTAFSPIIIVFSGLFRPLPFDARSLLIAIAALENTILLVLVVRTMKYLRWSSFLSHPVVLWALTYSVLWAGVYGLVVMANFGAGMRYKLQVLPFIMLLLFLLLRPEGRAALAGGSPAAT